VRGFFPLDELYITTAWFGFGEEQRSEQPWAGDLFRAKMGVHGLVEPGCIGLGGWLPHDQDRPVHLDDDLTGQVVQQDAPPALAAMRADDHQVVVPALCLF
jgi:hypothetical protein